MAPKAEGMWPCVVLGATCGESDGQIVVRVNVKIEDGPDKGKLCTYEDTVNPKSSIYIARSCRAVGWKGRDLTATLTADVDAWIKETGGKSTVEIRHIAVRKGKKFDKWAADHDEWISNGGMGKEPQPPVWDKVQSLGRGPAPLAPPTKQAAADANDYMRQALADDGFEPPPDDDVPPPTDNDLPF